MNNKNFFSELCDHYEIKRYGSVGNVIAGLALIGETGEEADDDG